jgi:Carboxypeptidase regulatory-like domain/TonB-dependent Receptor Plug Domain
MSHRWCGIGVCVLVSMVAAVAPAAAQVQTGSVYVRVVDDQGAVVPGVTITISSPVLPRDHVGVTDASGVFQVPGLSVGIYTVRGALQGFQTVNRADIVVRQGQTANVEIAMKVSGLSEEVTVRGESPVVDTKTVGAQVNIDTNLIEKAPGGRDIWNVIEYKAPGVVVESPDVGGNQGGLQRSLSARGTPNAQNTQVLNGVNVNDPAAQGFAMYYYVPTTLENIQVSTGGQDIAVGTGGVFINMVTKSGTNRFTGMALQTYQGAPTQSSNIDEPLLQAGLRPDANSTELLTNTNVQAGGPLLRNKLFYFGTFNYQATHVNVPNFPAVIPSYIPSPLADTSDQDTTDIIAGEGKISYQPDGRNRFEGFIAKQRYDKPNRGAGGTVTVLNANVLAGTQDSDSKELDTFFIAQLAYNRVMSDRMFIDSKISYNNTHFPLFQKTDLQPLSDTSTAVLFRNRQSSQIMFRRRIQFVANWQYFLPELLGGRHEFKAGIDNGHTPEDVDTLRIGEVNLSHSSLPTPRAGQVQIFNTPLHQERAVTSTALYAQDAYSIGRLTLTGGIRWERIEGYLPAQQAPPSEYFPEGLVFEDVSINGVVQDFTVRKSFDAVKENPLWYNWGPRVSATYDIRGNGKTVARVSYGKYLDQINTGTPPNPNANINQAYAWNDLNGDLIFQKGNATWNGTQYVGGEFGALASTGNLAVATFDNSVRRPYRNELTVGVDHELLPDVLFSVAYLRTREHDVTGTVDQNIALWDQLFTPITLTDPGRDGVLGTADDAPLTVYNQNTAGAVTSPVTINDDRLATRYDGVDVVISKRYSRGWALLAGYTYSGTRVDLTSLANPNAAFVNASGESGGRRHNFKASGTYDLPYQIVFGANFRLASGLPITRTWATPAAQLRQGSVTVNAEPRGSVELDWLPTLDLRAGRYFTFGGNRLELSMDLYNATNANTVFATRTNTGLASIRVGGDPAVAPTQIAAFLSPTAVLAPRVLRFNISYQFGSR